MGLVMNLSFKSIKLLMLFLYFFCPFFYLFPVGLVQKSPC
jgi:hypothetical protein